MITVWAGVHLVLLPLLFADYCAEKLTGAVVPYVALKEVANEMVCLSESHLELNFLDVISARRYYHSR